MVTKREVIDLIKVVMVAFIPPIMMFLEAVVGGNIANAIAHAETRQELIDRLADFMALSVFTSAAQVAVAVFALCSRLYSARVKRIAPWILSAGVAASIAASWMLYYSVTLFDKEWWRYFAGSALYAPAYAAYLAAAERWLGLRLDYD